MVDSQRAALLTREVASLAGDLHRESQRREAVASHSRDLQERIQALESSLRQARYVNSKLEKEVALLKVDSHPSALDALR
jgi:chromosome segregation ATPase